MKKLCYLTLVFFGISCNAIRVDYDYDRATDFSNYSTYNYFTDIESGLSQLDEKRLVKALDSTLQAKGYLLAEEPDFNINIVSAVYRNSPSNNVGVGIGGTGGRVGGGVSIGLPIQGSGLKREIQIDFVDSQKEVLFWQGTSISNHRENASPDEREAQFKKVVDKIFVKFPPERK